MNNHSSELIDYFNRGIRADTSLQGLHILYIAAQNAENEAFRFIDRFASCSISVRAIIHSFAGASMCVVILKVC